MSDFKRVKPGQYIAEDNFENPVTEFYLGVYVKEDGAQGVIAFIESNFPFVEKTLMGATIRDRDAIIKACHEAKNEYGIKCKVLRFRNVEVIEEFN